MKNLGSILGIVLRIKCQNLRRCNGKWYSYLMHMENTKNIGRLYTNYSVIGLRNAKMP